MSYLLGPLLFLSATFALSHDLKHLIAPNTFHEATDFTLDQLAQINLSNGANLTLIIQPGEHALTRLLSIHNFTHVEIIGQNTSAVVLHDRGWIELLDIDQLSIEGLSFTGHKNTNSFILPIQRLHISDIQTAVITNCSFSGLDTLQVIAASYQEIDQTITQKGDVLNIRNTVLVMIEKVLFKDNNGTALKIYMVGYVSVQNSTFIRNQQGPYGGAVYIGSITAENSCINNSLFISNSARRFGGAIYIETGNVNIVNSDFTGNIATNGGGGIAIYSGTVLISHCNMTKNIAENGGGIDSSGSLSIFNSSLTGNIAGYGGGIKVVSAGNAIISHTTLTGNNADIAGGGIIVLTGSASIAYSNLTGSRAGQNGAAIAALQSQIYVSGDLNINNNAAARFGGAVFLRESGLVVKALLKISNNIADEGGGIYAYRSTITFQSTGWHHITNNIAVRNGGGIYAVASSIKISRSFVNIDSNRAQVNGGGLCLYQNTKVYIHKMDFKQENVNLTIHNNTALLGGGIFIDDSTAGKDACSRTDFGGECFLRTINMFNSGSDTISTFITDNTATIDKTGSAIYGGLLDRCTSISPTDDSSSIEYFKRTVKLPEHSISSDPLQVKLCDGSTTNLLARKGQMFIVNIKAIDQVGNTINATIHGSVKTKSGIGRLKEGQVEQQVGSKCTDLEYNVFSEDSSAQVELYAIGPCANWGISRLLITVTFLNCSCPLGFHPIQSSIDCSCECDQKLHASGCFPEEGTFQLDNTLWVGTTNYSETEYIVHDCPLDYCEDQPVNISLNSSQWIDKQCAYKRSGVLCGECEEGLSLMLASSKCKECSNAFLFLLFPFAVAGIALVVFILWLNITIATGTIYGLIFYANVLAANKAIFLPFKYPNFLTVFVSWVNLDLGIETCFYYGMNSQAKVLLQLAFPFYLFLLMFLIIMLSAYVNSFANILSNRNPVAALCTLLILTYSKLLRMIIAALQFTSLLNYTVWLYDGNVLYFSPSHIPRFVAAAVILTACALLTTLLFFGQWFPRCSNWKVMKWTKNTKYIGFMDAFHAPFTPKHRYWVGLLLFALIAHNLSASMAPDTSVPVLSAGCIAVGLIVYKSLMNCVYKNSLNNALENLFLLNVAILALGTFAINNYNDRQLALAYTSMAIAFILFVVIICCHFYKYVVKKTNIWNNQVRPLNPARRINFNFHRNRNYERLAEIDDNDDVELPAVVDMYSYGQEPREETDPDKYITPPIIRPATRPDQLREPDLDILAPVTEEDYGQAPGPIPQAENCPRPVVTSTVVEITKDS